MSLTTAVWTIIFLAAASLFWPLAAGVAGVGYGLAYRQGGLRAAVLAH